MSLRCPNGHTRSFTIYGTALVDVVVDADERRIEESAPHDLTWDDGDVITCDDCHYQGEVQEFDSEVKP